MAKSGTGIIIGRFQVAALNAVHKKLINKVLKRHKMAAVFLGTNPAPSDINPIDLLFRLDLIEEEYGSKVEILEMPDLPDDRIWSQELDRRILEMRPTGEVTIYGTTLGFVETYSGKYKTEALEVLEEDLPDVLSIDQGWDLRSFRAGILFATMRRFPTVYPTVDIAVFRNDFSEVLLARKENETKFRFPGGFTDPGDESFEMAVMRELLEECGDIAVQELVYIGSAAIEDWRYKSSVDSIITHLYVCTFIEGEPVASDDIAELRWFAVPKLRDDQFVAEHRELWNMVTEYLNEEEGEED